MTLDVGTRVWVILNPRFSDRETEAFIVRWRPNSGGGDKGWYDVAVGPDRSVRPSQVRTSPRTKPTAEALGFIDRADVPVDRMRRSIHRSHRGEGKNFVD